MATPRIAGYVSQHNLDYAQEAYTLYMAKHKKPIPMGQFLIEAIKEYCDKNDLKTEIEPELNE